MARPQRPRVREGLKSLVIARLPRPSGRWTAPESDPASEADPWSRESNATGSVHGAAILQISSDQPTGQGPDQAAAPAGEHIAGIVNAEIDARRVRPPLLCPVPPRS